MRHVLTLLAAALALPASLVAQSTSSSSAQPSGARASQEKAAPAEVTVTGCLARAADGRGFVLRNVESAPGTVDSSTTSPAAGTSATGDAPSGSVTGRTPTGSTAVVTAAPTPDAGTPGETASPASPTFQQPSAAGTAGTVARSDTDRRQYRLVAGAGVSLESHVGHTVELGGRVRAAENATTPVASAGDGSGKLPRKPAQPQGTAETTEVAQTLAVERLRHVSATCEQ